MKELKWYVILLVILLLFGGYLYFSTATGSVDPVGRLGFVKLANPDMYPGHPHSELLSKYAQERGSKCALVVHFGGSSNYRHFNESNVTIIELAFIDTKGATTSIDWNEVVQIFLFGIPEDRWKFKADGKIFNNYEDAMEYVNNLAAQNGQQGPMPMVWHGTARGGDPKLNPGCGFPLYFYVTWKEYGRFAAYWYVIKGYIFPYISNPYKNYELQHASELQYYYTHNMLNID